MSIEYKINESIATDQVIGLLNNSKPGERRPVDDYACMEGIIFNRNLTVSAWSLRIIGATNSRLAPKLIQSKPFDSTL